jgi:sigma-54 specific flagellar transcriptional regulator A
MQKTTSLVIDDNRVRARELGTLLKALKDWEVTLAGTDDWMDCLGDNRGLQAIFLGHCGPEEKLVTVVQTIQAMNANLPMVLFEDPDQVSNLPPNLENVCSARLTWPFNHFQLTNMLDELNQGHQGSQIPGQKRSAELFRSLCGNSPVIAQVRNLITRVAPSDATVLILGASGTGKEVVARNIHYFSSRRKRPFVPINCGAIPANLLESELFGHEKGAFTGAITARQGRFELARGGTLFLDEIGDMPLDLQVTLLRVLEERTFERVGSNTSISADVRIVAATHRNLEQLISTGQFREDLYYRLNVFPIEIPTLKERIEDLPFLVEDLTSRLEHELGIKIQLSPAAIDCLGHHPWPGNVRELANLMERLVILHPSGVVEVEDLPAKFRTGYPEKKPGPRRTATASELLPGLFSLPEDGIDLKQYLMDLESHLIQEALDKANGVTAHAASLLKLRRTTLVEKMRKYAIKRNV